LPSAVRRPRPDPAVAAATRQPPSGSTAKPQGLISGSDAARLRPVSGRGAAAPARAAPWSGPASEVFAWGRLRLSKIASRPWSERTVSSAKPMRSCYEL